MAELTRRRSLTATYAHLSVGSKDRSHNAPVALLRAEPSFVFVSSSSDWWIVHLLNHHTAGPDESESTGAAQPFTLPLLV